MPVEDVNKDNCAPTSRIKVNKFDFELFTLPDRESLFVGQVYEELTSLFIRQMAKGVSTFIDIGAQHGFFEVLVNKINSDCEIIAFEPDQENLGILQRNLSLHSINAQVHQTDTLDPNILNANQGTLLLRIDADGNGITILKSLEDFLNDSGDVRLFIKFSPDAMKAKGQKPEELLAYLCDLNYQVQFIDDNVKKFFGYKNGQNWDEIIDSEECNLYCQKKETALNLCFFSHSSQLAGAERALLNLTEELISDYGAVCTVILPDDGPLEKMLSDSGCATHIIPYKWWCTNSKRHLANFEQRFFESFKQLESQQILDKIQPDIVVTQTLTIPWGAVYAYEHQMPHLWMVSEFGELDHGLHFYFAFDQVIQFIKDYSDVIITCSDAVRQELFNGDKKAKTVYYSLEKMKSEIKAVRTSKNIFENPDAFHLLLPGTISPGKGQIDAVRAVIELVQNRNENIELILIGYALPEYQSEIEEIIGKAEAEKYIKIRPFAEAIYPVMASADAILVTSKNEAFGRVTVESMLLNKPVIGSNTGGTKELIQNGVNGLTYSFGDEHQLADQIQNLIHDPSLRHKLTERGKEFVQNNFSKEKYSGVLHCDMIKIKHFESTQPRNSENSVKDLNLIEFYRIMLDRGLDEIRVYEQQKEEFRQRVIGLNEEIADQNDTQISLQLEINKRDQSIDVLKNELNERGRIIKGLNNQIEKRKQQYAELEQEMLYYALSNSWRITRPIRKLMNLLHRRKNA